MVRGALASLLIGAALWGCSDAPVESTATSGPGEVLPPPSGPTLALDPAAPTAPQGPATGTETAAPAPAATAQGEDETPLELLVPDKLPPKKKGFVRVTGMVNADFGRPTPITKRVKICPYQPKDIPCVGTRVDGTFAIDLPQMSQVALRFEGPGLTPALRAFITRKQDVYLGNTRVANAMGLAKIANAMETSLQEGTGAVFFSGVEGVSARLEPPSGRLFYLNVANQWIPEATGILLRGTAGFLNVDPGIVRLRFSHPKYKCRFRYDNTMSGWPDPKDPSVAVVPIVANQHTYVTTMYCGK